MNPFKRRRLKKDWRLVKTVEGHFVNGENEVSGRVYYYLYENGLGERKVDHEGTGYCSGPYCRETRKQHRLYLGRIRPWLDGAYDPEIPSYDTIKQKEFKDALKGSKT